MEGLYHASITRSRPRGLARSRASASVKSALPKSGNIEGASIIMAPRKFSGPIQQGAIRVLRDMEVASTSDIMPTTHPRQHNPQHRSRSLRRVLDEIAIGVGRAGGPGNPGLLRLVARVVGASPPPGQSWAA